jgi:4-hydroxybenzoyl-CoA reductase subunit beta
MLRMDGFDYLHAATPEQAVALWHSHDDAMYVAGGTDLLPNLKHRIFQPRHLVGIAQCLDQGWTVDGGSLVIGAGTKLSALAGCTELPMLATAAGCVAGPQIRNMGTLGGNVLLDTRCLFYNQSEFWRESLGYCLKAEGTWCHVIDGPKTCVATQSSDTVPALMALGASLRVLGPDGSRDLPLTQLFRFNGMDHLKITAGDLLTHIVVPLPGEGHRASYQKLRTRGAIDFPQLGIAIAGTFRGTGAEAVAESLQIVVGAINPQPKVLPGLAPFQGATLDDDTIEALGEIAYKRSRPQASVQGEPTWRRSMARVLVERALRRLRDDLPVAAEGE